MTTLAPKLPYSHPFAGGYPRIGGQALPTDPDAIDYLERVAAADGAAVEVGVAMAVDQFVKGCKADSAGYAGDPTRTVWDALQACCIMAGARTISGALVPLVGDAPTPYNFTGSDYSRTTGLKGDGGTTYLDSGRANNADGQNDQHAVFYASVKEASNKTTLGSYSIPTASGTHISDGSGSIFTRSQSVSQTATTATAAGFTGVSRSDSAEYLVRSSGSNTPVSVASAATSSLTLPVFAFNYNGTIQGFSSARLAFYSIGSALDLAALDARVSTLISSIAAALA